MATRWDWIINISIPGGGCSSVAKSLVTKTRLDSGTETLIPTIGGGFDVSAIALAGNTIGRKPENGGNGTGFDASGSMYTLTKTDIHAVTFDTTQITSKQNGSNPKFGDPCHPLASGAHAPAIAFSVKDDGRGAGDISPTICNQHTGIGIAQNMQVRRLTPKECARLQGFPDDYLSQVLGASDTQMYRALGNSMAVNVMQILGERIQMVSEIKC